MIRVPTPKSIRLIYDPLINLTQRTIKNTFPFRKNIANGVMQGYQDIRSRSRGEGWLIYTGAMRYHLLLDCAPQGEYLRCRREVPRLTDQRAAKGGRF